MSDTPFVPSEHTRKLMEQAAIERLHVAISPWRYTPAQRLKFEQGMLRIGYGEMMMKRAREKNGQSQ